MDKIQNAIKQYKSIKTAVDGRKTQKHNLSSKLQKMTESTDTQRVVVDDLADLAEKTALQVGLGVADDAALQEVVARLGKAKNDLGSMELTISAIQKELLRIDAEVNPAQRPPLELAKEAFCAAVFEEARGKILKNALADLHRAHVARQLVAGVGGRGTDDADWSLLVKILSLPAPTREDRVEIARSIEGMIEPDNGEE